MSSGVKQAVKSEARLQTIADTPSTLSGQMATANYVSKTKGCQRASLFSTNTQKQKFLKESC